ncbi:hypothetical protein GBF38_001390 [Nibea albiflora]|uniref:Uncharacterized protein n=1 Tax=Nibea albiflora TaxID=240163 RepID=A0ACB7ETG4_NIBAL|nr:hypothetical protein GBF38_001390 [Nibea albiflora]
MSRCQKDTTPPPPPPPPSPPHRDLTPPVTITVQLSCEPRAAWRPLDSQPQPDVALGSRREGGQQQQEDCQQKSAKAVESRLTTRMDAGRPKAPDLMEQLHIASPALTCPHLPSPGTRYSSVIRAEGELLPLISASRPPTSFIARLAPEMFGPAVRRHLPTNT